MSNDIVQKLGEIKQYQSKLPKTIISKVSSKVFEILGGVNPILDHYISNARYLKVNQIKELHKLLQQTKRQFYKKQLKKKQVRHASSSSNGANNLLSQSYTPLATTPPGYVCDNNGNKAQRLMAQRKRAHTAGKSPKQRRYKNKPQHINAAEMTPIFLSKSADFEPPRPHKRKGSGLEQRMRFEFTKNRPKSPIANHIVSLSAISNVSVPRSMTDAEFLNITNINLTNVNTKNRAIVTESDVEDSVKTTIEHEMDEVRPQNIMIDDEVDDEFGRIRMQSGSGISTINIEKFTPIQPIFYDDKKRRYSISEQSDWDTDDDQMETKKSHEYFDKLSKKYGKKNKGKNKKKRRKKKTQKLKRMAMEQMKKEKTVKKEEKQSMSALDALVSVLDEENDYSENRKHENDMEMNGDYDKRGNGEFEEGQDTKVKVDNVKQANVKPSIDSAEFKEYFERFMQENSSFYAYKLEHMDGAEDVDLECDYGDDSDVSSMEHEDYQHQFQ